MIRTDRAHLTVVAQTHAGMTGKNNEDRYAVTSFQLSEDDPTPVLFAVVADGIGGHRAGEVAAELAGDHIAPRKSSNGPSMKPARQLPITLLLHLKRKAWGQPVPVSG